MEAIWVGTAYGIGMLANRFTLPPLVGYLIAGFILWALGLKGSELLSQIAEVGVLLMLFKVGLKLRISSLLRPEVLGPGGLHLLIISVALGSLGVLLGLTSKAAVFIGAGLAFSSTVLAIKLLEDRREVVTFHGRTIIAILVLQDLVAVGLLAFVGIETPNLWILLFLAFPLLRPVLAWALGKSGHDELLLLFGITMALAGAAIAHFAGISPELGALVAGALLAGQPQASELSRILWTLKEAFLVAFFLQIGLLGFPSFEHLPLVGLVLLALPLQAVLFFALFILFGLRARTAFVGAVSLSSYSEFALITTNAAIHGQILPEHWGPVMGLVVAASLALVAPLNRYVHPIYERLEPFLLRFERPGLHPDQEPTQLGDAQWLVVGMGRTGGSAYKILERHGTRVVGIDADVGKIERHTSKGRNVVYGDAEDPELWSRLDLSNIQGILLTMPDLEAKVRALNGLKQRGFNKPVAVTSYRREEDSIFQALGATLVFHPFAEAGARLAERALGVSLIDASDSF